jgi:CTP synthase (UTP-ammonia lyase)
LSHDVHIALIGDHDPAVTAHRAIPVALERAGSALGLPVLPTWIRTDAIPDDVAPMLSTFHGVWCVPASPYASMDGALRAIRFARECPLPYLGTCGGYQHALIEHARNVAGLDGADHAETNPDASILVIGALACPMVEQSERIRLAAGSRLRELVGAPEIVEEYHCRFGVNPEHRATLERTGLHAVAFGERDEVRAFERRDHPFFVLTAFQPERSALAGRDHGLIQAFVAAAHDRARSGAAPPAGASRRS